MKKAINLKIGFSPCPNDTFIFDALIHKKIDAEYFDFETVITDVEELNKKALNNELDITKLSFQTYFKIKGNYDLLNSGSALGTNCGPILISKKKYNINEIVNLNIAIPGINTTANLLLKIAFGDKAKTLHLTEMLFSEIEDAILKGKVDAGVIIHESRFTYQDKGLIKIMDLGEYWESITNSPIPLGCIVIRKNFSKEIKITFDKVLKSSIEFALKNPDSGYDFIKDNAQELSDGVIKKHIELYVNNYTLDLGKNGRKAIDLLEYYYRELN